MSPVKQFDEFLRENIVHRQSPDKSRAAYLIAESQRTHRNLLDKIEKLEMKDDNANDFIKSCYDVLMELIRAKMLLDGYGASGFGAHEAEVSYLRLLGFKENDVQFADQMRFFRNGMLYYGKQFDKEYAQKVIEFTKKNLPKIGEMMQ